MKILMNGGCINPKCGGGDTVMITNISNYMNKTENVFYFPNLPLFIKKTHFDKNHFNDIKYMVVKKEFTFTVLTELIFNSFKWLKIIYKYYGISLFFKIDYFVSLIQYTLAEKEIRELKPDIIHIHGIGRSAIAFMEVALKNDIPILITIHGLDLSKSNYKHYLNKIKDEKIKINTVSSSVKNTLINEVGFLPSSIDKIFNGVDLNAFNCNKKENLRKKFDIQDDNIILLQVGTLSRRKNHIMILNAIKSLRNQIREKILYIIVGMGEEEDNLRSYVEKEGLEYNVLFMGFQKSKNLEDIYCIADFFILPSLSEGMPLVFLESIAAGLPIITYGDLESVDDIYTPFCMELIPDRSLNSTVNSIENAIGKKWDRNKIREYAEKWDWSIACNKYMKLYRKILSNC
jgi:glycosyltransferase involved in cell wall biosynthesis